MIKENPEVTNAEGRKYLADMLKAYESVQPSCRGSMELLLRKAHARCA